MDALTFREVAPLLLQPSDFAAIILDYCNIAKKTVIVRSLFHGTEGGHNVLAGGARELLLVQLGLRGDGPAVH